jgi:hypothetical protein
VYAISSILGHHAQVTLCHHRTLAAAASGMSTKMIYPNYFEILYGVQLCAWVCSMFTVRAPFAFTRPTHTITCTRLKTQLTNVRKNIIIIQELKHFIA